MENNLFNMMQQDDEEWNLKGGKIYCFDFWWIFVTVTGCDGTHL